MNVTAAPRRAQEQVRNNSYQTSNVLSQSFKGGWQLSMQGRQMSISRCWISSQEGQILIEYVVCKIFHIVCKLCDLCRHSFVSHSRAVQDLLQKYWIYYPLKPCRQKNYKLYDNWAATNYITNEWRGFTSLSPESSLALIKSEKEHVFLSTKIRNTLSSWEVSYLSPNT